MDWRNWSRSSPRPKSKPVQALGIIAVSLQVCALPCRVCYQAFPGRWCARTEKIENFPRGGVMPPSRIECPQYPESGFDVPAFHDVNLCTFLTGQRLGGGPRCGRHADCRGSADPGTAHVRSDVTPRQMALRMAMAQVILACVLLSVL